MEMQTIAGKEERKEEKNFLFFFDSLVFSMIHFKAQGERVVVSLEKERRRNICFVHVLQFAGWPAILTSLAHGVSLITVATLVLDFLAVYVLKEKQIIYPEKYAEPKMKQN
jgi:hypothetical protein